MGEENKLDIFFIVALDIDSLLVTGNVVVLVGCADINCGNRLPIRKVVVKRKRKPNKQF